MAGELLIDAGPKEESAFPSKIVLGKLVDKRSVQTVFHEGKKRVSDVFVLYTLRSAAETPCYAIFMKKHFGIAVERNHAKRLIRAALHQMRHTILGYDMVLIPRTKMKGLGLKQIVDELQQLFNKSGRSRQA